MNTSDQGRLSGRWVVRPLACALALLASPLFSQPAVAGDAGANEPPTGFECGINTEDSTQVLRVAVAASNPSPRPQPKPWVIRVLSPKLRELWSVQVSSTSEVSCESGALVFTDETGLIRFDSREAGEQLTLSSERAKLRSALDAAWKSTPGPQEEAALSLEHRVNALWRAAGGLAESGESGSGSRWLTLHLPMSPSALP